MINLNYPSIILKSFSNPLLLKSKIALGLCFITLFFAACKKSDDTGSIEPDEVISGEYTEEPDDYLLDSAAATKITLSGNSITVNGEGVSVDGGTATITAAGTYRVTGKLSNGQLIVDAASSKVKIILDNTEITSSSSSPLYIKNSLKTILYLNKDTKNILSDGNGNTIGGTVFSNSNLLLFGTGQLTINGNAKHGLVSKATLFLKDGDYTINSIESTIKADKDLIITGGTYTLAAGNDGLHADAALTIDGGTINITKAEEGIEGDTITINNGNIHLVSTDDGLNGASDDNIGCFFNMKGGYLYINAEGDGIDVNGSIQMSGGVIIVDGPTGNGNGAIDYDNSFTITGGYLLAVGSAGMAQIPGASSSQNSVIISLASAQPATTLVHIANSSGEEIFTYKPSKRFQSIAFSSPDLAKGSYSLYVGGSSTGTVTDGLYSGGNYTLGTLKGSFSISNVTTSVRAN